MDIECDTETGPRMENYAGETKRATKHTMTEHHVVHGTEANDSTTWEKQLNDEEGEGVRRRARD